MSPEDSLLVRFVSRTGRGAGFKAEYHFVTGEAGSASVVELQNWKGIFYIGKPKWKGACGCVRLNKDTTLGSVFIFVATDLVQIEICFAKVSFSER